jgi:hypothetical protein
VLEPVEQYSCLRGSWQRSWRGRWLLRRSSLFQSLKEVHCHPPLISSVRVPSSSLVGRRCQG